MPEVVASSNVFSAWLRCSCQRQWHQSTGHIVQRLTGVAIPSPVIWNRSRSTARAPGMNGTAAASQEEIIVKNSEPFLAGLPANNVLLWARVGRVCRRWSRRCWTVCLVILVEKRTWPTSQRFFPPSRISPIASTMLCDDLTFEVGELSYKMLKSALDGSVYSVRKMC